MLSLSRMISAHAVLALLLATGAYAQAAGNPWEGVWELNVARSKFDPGPPFKSQTRTHQTAGDMDTMIINGIDGDGKAVTIQSTYRLDGKDYPVTGSTKNDALALKKIDDSTVSGAVKRNGKVVMNVTRTLSHDGKSMTVTTQGTNEAGQPMHNVLVFDRR